MATKSDSPPPAAHAAFMLPRALAERALNHLLRATPGASDTLLRHRGMSVRFELGLTRLDFRIADDGYFSEAAVEEADAPDATIAPTAALLASLPFAGRDAWRHADYSGDPALLATLDRVFQSLRSDLAAELAPFVGDIAATRLASVAGAGRAGVANAAQALGMNVSEYLVEEIELMARRVDIERFKREVDTLADDVARLEARLQRLDR